MRTPERTFRQITFSDTGSIMPRFNTAFPSGLLLLSLVSGSAVVAQDAAQAVASGVAAPAKDSPGQVATMPAVSPAAATNTAAKAEPSSAYRIGADDVLQVTVWREPTLSGPLPVRPDGMISLVLLGDVLAAGRTPMELAADITTRLKRFLQDPLVSVTVTAANSQKIFVTGEVGKVGAIALTAGMTPLQAISASGGVTPFAKTKGAYILRTTGKGQVKLPFNYKKALKGQPDQNIVLQPGDMIVVP